MALTKVQKTGITDNAIDADKIEDGTVVAADIANGTITNDKLAGSIANDKLANSSITVNGNSVSLGGSVSAGKVQWQTVKTTDFNAVAGEGYFVDTDSVGAVTATLPGSPSAGDTIAFKDYAENFGTNGLTIARNGNNIQGVANDSLISTNRASIVLVYIDATKGWLYTNESNVAFLGPTYMTATGGTVTTSGDYKIHTFTGDGSFVVSSLGNLASGPLGNSVSYMVVAGGGGSGDYFGAGGGAGGFREGYNPGSYTASPLATSALPVSATTYPITVGAGGSDVTRPGNNVGGSGSNSVFSTITSAGGGGGSGGDAGGTTGGSGGSGGGGGGSNPQSAGSGNTPPTSPSQGNNGGGAVGCGGGGGGGATAAGTAGPTEGVGGAGAGTEINPSPSVGTPGPSGPLRYFAGGGAGSYVTGGGGGGVGGGGNNGGFNSPLSHGTANTGGGGGNESSLGGSGIVIIRYKFQ